MVGEEKRGLVLARLFWEWFKISLFVIGGGYAIIVVADAVFGRKRKWLAEGELLDRLPIFQTVPGLIAGNSAVYVGRRVAGLAGAFVALCGVALPSFAIVLAVAYGFSSLPVENRFVQGAFVGLRSALAGLVLATVATSWRRIVHGVWPWIAVPASFLLLEAGGANPAHVLVGAMAVGVAWRLVRPGAPAAEEAPAVPPSPPGEGRALLRAALFAALALALAAAFAPALARIFLLFAKFGLLCFGGGFVLTPLYLRSFVRDDPLVSYEQFGNLLALTQATPGPVSVNAATFFGFHLGARLGFPFSEPVGSLVATVGLLAPSFFLLVLALRSLDRFRGSRVVRGLLWGVAPATIGLMLSALLVFLQMSVFTEPIPWRGLAAALAGGGADAVPASFRFRPSALALALGVAWAFSKTRVSIVALILACAAAGAAAFPALGL